MRGRTAVVRWAHNPQVGGSIPPLASTCIKKQGAYIMNRKEKPVVDQDPDEIKEDSITMDDGLITDYEEPCEDDEEDEEEDDDDDDGA